MTWPPWHDLYDVTIHDMTSISWPPGTVYTWEVQVGEVGAPGHEAQQSSVSHSGTVLQLCQNKKQMITNTVVRWYLLRILKFQLMLLCKSEKTVLFYQIIKSTFNVFWKIGWFRLNKITSWYSFKCLNIFSFFKTFSFSYLQFLEKRRTTVLAYPIIVVSGLW